MAATGTMKQLLRIIGIGWLLISSACVSISPFGVGTTPAQLSATPPENDVEFFGIGGRALVDVNGNGKIDATDLPLPDAKLTVMDGTGGSVSALTDDQGYAMTGVPNGMKPIYPVILRMEPPPGGKYVVVEPGEYTWSKAELIKNGLGAEFLFTLAPQ